MAFFFSGPNKASLSLIDKERFLDSSLSLKPRLPERSLLELFSLIDINSSGTISQSEFFLLFEEPEKREKNKENIRLPDELQREIQGLFMEVDTDKSNFIDKNELGQALMKVGMNPTLQELEQYLGKFDKDGDGKISFEEFRYIFQDKLKNEMMVMDELISNLRKEFKKADIYQNRLLGKEQLQ